MRFSQCYVDNVLAVNFRDARKLFLRFLLDVHRAHLIMLVETRILPADIGRGLVEGLQKVEAAKIEDAAFDGSFEDLFFYVERLLEEACGPDVAGRLHTARSRNDIDVTLYRMRWREETLAAARACWDLRKVLLRQASLEAATVMPAYTHTQPAQPITAGHFFQGVAEHLERDHERLMQAVGRMNLCPLGACAIAGTGFPIDRFRTSELLAFDGPSDNTYSSIAAVDYLLEPLGAIMTLMVELGRFVQDLLKWSNQEFDFLRLSDGFVQCSSLMPQKRNPVALEHCRALASLSFSQATAVFHSLHNTPYGDVVDIEDDVQPLVSRAFRDAVRVLRLLAAALETAEFQRENMRTAAVRGNTTMTELADTLVRRTDASFRQAHRTTALFQEVRRKHPEFTLSEALDQAAAQVLGRPLGWSLKFLEEVLSPENFVRLRSHFGGPAPEILQDAIARSMANLSRHETELQCLQQRFEEFPQALRVLANSLK
jgi:argininosuccinate lyase